MDDHGIRVTRAALLGELKTLFERWTGDMALPVARQRAEEDPETRAPEVFLMRLPDAAHAKKLVPYIIVQLVTGVDVMKTGRWEDSQATVRFIFAVYDENGETGSLALMNVMDRVRLGLMREPITGAFKLDTDRGLESLVYIDDTAPYYAGEMIGTFFCPPIKREVLYGD